MVSDWILQYPYNKDHFWIWSALSSKPLSQTKCSLWKRHSWDSLLTNVDRGVVGKESTVWYGSVCLELEPKEVVLWCDTWTGKLIPSATVLAQQCRILVVTISNLNTEHNASNHANINVTTSKRHKNWERCISIFMSTKLSTLIVVIMDGPFLMSCLHDMVLNWIRTGTTLTLLSPVLLSVVYYHCSRGEEMLLRIWFLACSQPSRKHINIA
jgi:hypothetical protein